MHPDKPAPTGAVFLAIISILFWFLGFGIYTQAKSAVHEIEALASFIIAAVLLVGAVLASGITSLRRDFWNYRVGQDEEGRVPAEPILADAAEPAQSPMTGESLVASVSNLLHRMQPGPAPKSAKEQLEELRAKERERSTGSGPSTPHA